MSRGNRKRSPNAPAPPPGLRRRFVFRRRPEKTARRGDANRVTKQRASSHASAPYLVLLMVVIGVVAAAFIYHLHVRFEGVRLGYETSQARAERAQLLVERRELRLELASLKSLDRIEAEARQRLDMEIPDHKRIIPVRSPKRKTVATSGGAR